MTLKTIESYIRYTAKPYSKILDSAVRGGLEVKSSNGITTISDSRNHFIHLYWYDPSDVNQGLAASMCSWR